MSQLFWYIIVFEFIYRNNRICTGMCFSDHDEVTWSEKANENFYHQDIKRLGCQVNSLPLLTYVIFQMFSIV